MILRDKHCCFSKPIMITLNSNLGDDLQELVTPMSDDDGASDIEPEVSTEELRRQAAASLGLSARGSKERTNTTPVTNQTTSRASKRPAETSETRQPKRPTGRQIDGL